MSSNVSNAGFYADFSALTALKKNVKADDPQAIRAAAQQFESLFTDMMLKSMREAKLGEGLGESQETDFYQDMYDQQLALQMSQGKGLGLADLLVQQLTRSSAASTAASNAASNAASTAGSSAATGGGPSPAPQSLPAAPGAEPAGGGAGAAGTGAAGAGAAGATSHAQRIGFIQMLQPYAQRAAAQLGVSADSLIAQAALETGWGQRVPSGSGGSSYNLFGVKTGSGWDGGSARAATTEYQQGAAVSSVQQFRSYSSLQQGINDYVSLLQRSASYQPALGTGADVAAFASALQRGGYATDPNYADKLTATAAAVQALRTSAAGGALKLAASLPT